MKIQFHVEDRWWWEAESSGEYSVSSTYCALLDQQGVGDDRPVFAMLWKLPVPPKVKLFLWRLFLNRLPTRSNLFDRGIQIQSTVCLLCSSTVETDVHLILNRRRMRPIWNLSLQWLNEMYVIPGTTIEHFMSQSGVAGCKARVMKQCIWASIS